MTMESNRKKIWTIPRLQGAVKATFFARALQDRKDEFDIELRYRDMKAMLSVTEGPVSDRTLSRALAGLVASGHLEKSGVGKKTRYKVVIPRSDLIAAYAKSDSTSITVGSNIGAVGRIDEGWAFYGVPAPLANRLRPILRREASAFRERVAAVLDEFAEGVIHKIVLLARGRLSRKEIRAGEEGLWRMLQQSTLTAMLYFGGSRFWEWIEQTHPGALSLVRRSIGLDALAETGRAVPVDQFVKIWTFLTGIPEEKLRPAFERESKALSRHVAAANRLIEALPRSRRERALKELGNLTPLGSALTAVIHHL
ncbi:MAG: hypothetical protein L3K17_02155 [Thermoplasmata archaeon]|nr:hypothetical protein [Thermoplasmata archaeon]